MMLKKLPWTIVILVLITIFLSSFALASTFSPQGDIDLRNRHDIINGENATFDGTVNTSILYINGSRQLGGVTDTNTQTTFNETVLQNQSGTWGIVGSFFDGVYVRFSNIVSVVGNWTQDRVFYYNMTEIDSQQALQNTSISNLEIAIGDFINTSDEGNLNVNSSVFSNETTFFDDKTSFNVTQFLNKAVVTISDVWLNTIIYFKGEVYNISESDAFTSSLNNSIIAVDGKANTINDSVQAVRTGYLNKTASESVLTGNLTVIDEVRASRFRFVDDGNNSYIKVGDSEFSGSENAIVFGNNDPDLAAGAITTLFYAQENNTLFWTQFGQNNSYGGWGNSFGLVPNNLGTNNFTNASGQVNMTRLSNYLEICSFFEPILGIDCQFNADTTGEGSLLFTTGVLEVFRQSALHGLARFFGGITSFGSADFVMDGGQLNVFNGSIHVSRPVVFETGFVEGDNINNLQATFPGTLAPFVNNQSDSGNWQSVSDVLCDDDMCAHADGSGVGDIDMIASFNTVDTNDTVLSFFYSLVGLVGGNTFTVYTNFGTGWNIVFTDSGTETLIQENITLSASHTNQSSVQVRFNCDAGSVVRECFVDSVVVNGTAMATTLANQSGFDSNYCTGDGSLDVNNQCNTGLVYDAASDTHFTRGTWNITGTVAGGVTGSGTANTVSKWSSSSAQTNSIMTDDGSIVIVTGGLGVRDSPATCPRERLIS